jgi:hypothetical protein
MGVVYHQTDFFFCFLVKGIDFMLLASESGVIQRVESAGSVMIFLKASEKKKLVSELVA